MNRIIGERNGESDEVLLVLIGAIHGNEMEGVKAIQNIIHTIDKDRLKLNGKLIGIAGNLKAIAQNKRYLNQDLNRLWESDNVNRIKNSDPENLDPEEQEAKTIIDLLEELSEMPYKKKVFIDLHTTSADNGNFLVYPGNAEIDPIVQSLKLPVVVNLETYINGTLMLYSWHKGFNAIVFEGGLIGSEKSVELHTYGLWQVLTSSGLVDEPHDIGLHIHYEELIGSLHSHLPKHVRVLHRHELKPKDYFHMKPGFENFQRIERGQLLAEDKKGLIHSPMSGFIFMPLYQNTGNDGFFIVEEVYSPSQ